MLRTPVLVFGSLTLLVGIAILRTIAGIGDPSAIHRAFAASQVDRRFVLAGASQLRIVCGALDVHIEPAGADVGPGTLRVMGALPPDVAAGLTLALDRPGGVATLTLRKAGHLPGWSFDLNGEQPIVVAYDLRVPTTVESDSGDVTVDEPQAPLAITAGSGDVRITALAGPLDVHTSSGDVTASLARRWSGNGIAIATSSGDIDLSVPAAVRIGLQISTSSGDVHDDAGLPPALPGSPAIAATTSSGDITVRNGHE